MGARRRKREKQVRRPAMEGTPLCPHCLEPYDPMVDYCPRCSRAVGRYTPYLPYVNIRFNVSIFGEMWKRLWSRRIPWYSKSLYVFLIITMAPIMLVGLPFALVKYFRNRHRSGQRPAPSD
jgi:hypothetical protein